MRLKSSPGKPLPEAIAPNHPMNPRTLKIEAVGDFAAQNIKPRIRLGGGWLDRAGFKPGHRVVIHHARPGKLTLRFQPVPAH